MTFKATRPFVAAVAFAVQALCLTATPAQAQSYNCYQGGLNPTEQTICQFPDLAEQDVYLNDLWDALTPADRNSLRGEQVAWRQERDWCGRDSFCIANAYDQRIGVLLSFLDGPAQGGVSGTPAESYGGNVRARPDVNSAWVASLAEGQPVTLLENTGVYFQNYPWFRIEFSNGRTGYQWGGILCDYDGSTQGLGGICNGSLHPQPTHVPSDPGIIPSRGADNHVTQFHLVSDTEVIFQVYWIDANANLVPAFGTTGNDWIETGETWAIENGGATWESHWYAIYGGGRVLCSFSPRQGAEVRTSQLTACGL